MRMMMVMVLMIVIDDDGNDDVDEIIVHNDYGDGDNNEDNEFESDRWR